MRTRFLKGNLHSSTWRIVLCFAGLYFLTFVLILPLTCHEWAYSAYFQKPKNLTNFIRRATELNNIAKTNAQQYFESIDAPETKTFYERLLKSTSLNLTIVVVTIDRHSVDKPGYLTQTLAKLDKIIKNGHHKLNVSLFMCNVNADRKLHKEIDIMKMYFVAQHSEKQESDRFEKEKQDYVFCIEQALETGSMYILVLEDDALPKDDILEVLYHLLNIHQTSNQGQIGQQELDHPHQTTIGNNDWAFMKLYYPARWRGFGWEVQHLVDLLSISAIGGLGFLAAFQVVFKWKRKYLLNKSQELVIFLLGSLYFALLVFTVGKPYVIEALAISKHLYRVSNAPECCTPAVLFTREKATEMIKYLKTETCNSTYALDLAMDSFVKSKSYVRLLVEPNLVTHIGMVSSIKHGMKFPQEHIFRR